MGFYTESGKKYSQSVTIWLQNTRLMSEAILRLQKDFNYRGKIEFTEESWSKSKKSPYSPNKFFMKAVDQAQRIEDLLKSSWKSQFIFLESLWEEYLQDLVLELGDNNVKLFEPFCEKDFMVDVIRNVLSDKLKTIEEIKRSAAERFAAGITRESWDEQWKQLKHLGFGLTPKDANEPWFNDLNVYFEMRNCIIHRGAKISPLLRQKSNFFANKDKKEIVITPGHLDYYRNKFLECVGFIEIKIEKTANSKEVKEAN